VLAAKKRIHQIDAGKIILARTVSMPVGLIRHTSAHRVYEQSVDYGIGIHTAGATDYDYDYDYD
jgi:hypothetical protein